MMKEKTLVSLEYHVYNVEGDKQTLLEESAPEHPLQFIVGDGMMVPSFEEEICKLSKDDTYDFIKPCEETFGPRADENVRVLAKEIFSVDGKFDEEHVKIGSKVMLMTQDGQPVPSLVLDITDEGVKVDLNHPMAGLTLRFVGKVLDLIELTQEQYDALHQSSCGCGGGCNGNCNGDCGGHCGDEHDGECHCGDEHEGDCHCGGGHCNC
ncbi:MAG: FKBP-type peptidyl-prolyl cis-trans isomerase [Bacteroidales bacterium]|nr:FKBP-type peptidyl-prolyl cis-trans isomerase [Bacteroidales bacterium]